MSDKMFDPVKQELYELDSAGIIYPYTRTRNWCQVFRVSVVLKKKVDPVLLQKTVNELSERFPTFFVQLKHGFFAYRLRRATDTNIVLPENKVPCGYIPVGKGDKPMFRIYYGEYRISLELFHTIADGTGAMRFLKTLTAHYLAAQGVPVEASSDIYDVAEPPKVEEIEDAFKKMYTKGLKGVPRSESTAIQWDESARINDYLQVTYVKIPLDALKQLSKAKNVTLTAYLTAAYIYSFYLNLEDKNCKKAIKISIPINLRPIFGYHTTVRNFSLYCNVGIQPNEHEYTFDDILVVVSKQLKEGCDAELLRRIASKNVHDAQQLYFKCLPNVLKRLLLNFGSSMYGERLFTAPFSNLGIVKVPEAIENEIENFEFVIGATKKNTIYFTAMTFKNTLTLAISTVCRNDSMQNTFLEFLNNKGLVAETVK